MSITPIQAFINSAVAQKSSLLAAAGSAPVSTGGDAAVSVNVTGEAFVKNISGQTIQASGLYNASLDLAAISSRINIAQAGTQQITNILQQLHDIAQQLASGSGGNPTNLEAQFQSLYAQINQIVVGSSFSGSSLLDGSFASDSNTLDISQPQNTGGQNSTPSIVPNLTTQGLFGASQPDVTTPQGAATAVNAIAGAQGIVSGANDNLNAISNQVNFAIASVETAQANGFASASVISESDLGAAGFASLAAGLLGKPSSSSSTQTSKLTSNVLSLISE